MSLSARRAWIEIIKKGRARRPGQVALRKESVDRNFHHNLNLPSKPVALRKESVDRNIRLDVSYNIIVKSLSARRAWIEIKSRRCVKRFQASLSARRAWIEMSF